ncbi:MAG TPA: DUF6139 family protein [Ramlibacter sp.]|nr:DUF6139 family protein [Ramlibacter sp.]
MQLDIYRRDEPGHKISYLAVPAGKPIPAEAVNVDWQVEARARELDEDRARFDDYAIDTPGAQLREKGYAITSVEQQLQAS